MNTVKLSVTLWWRHKKESTWSTQFMIKTQKCLKLFWQIIGNVTPAFNSWTMDLKIRQQSSNTCQTDIYICIYKQNITDLLFQYKIKEECVHRIQMPPLLTNNCCFFLLNYGITLQWIKQFCISLRDVNSEWTQAKLVEIELAFSES